MLLLTGIDRASHVLWAGMEPSDRYPPDLRLSDAERAAARATLEGYYEATDRLIGPLLERYGSEDLVLVVSDHGFEAAGARGDRPDARRRDGGETRGGPSGAEDAIVEELRALGYVE